MQLFLSILCLIYICSQAMSQSNLNSKHDKINSEDLIEDKRKRRTRNDDEGRNFTCICGKSYLSYPALYTHIKTKHNGKIEFTRAPNKEENSEDELSEEEKYEDANNMDVLKKYLTKFFPFNQKEREGDRKLKELSKQDQLYISNIKQYWDRRKKQDEPQLNQTYNTPIDWVLGKFLLDLENEVSKMCQRFLQDFIITLRNSMNQLQKNDKFCKSSCAANLPLMMNQVFTDSLQKLDDAHLYKRHPTIPCKLLFHFSRWLFQQRFTNQSLKLNTA